MYLNAKAKSALDTDFITVKSILLVELTRNPTLHKILWKRKNVSCCLSYSEVLRFR